MPTRAVDTSAQADASVGVGWRQPHYGELLQDRRAIDFLEVHSENFFAQGGAALAVLERGREAYPVSLHGVGLSLGSATGIDPWHLEQLSELVLRTDPVRVSDHASFARGRFRGMTVHASDLLPIPFTAEALEVLGNNVDQVQNKLKRRFMVENLSAYIAWNTPANEASLAETEFLMSLSRRTGCQLLVDVNNIYVNALNAAHAGRLSDPEAACREWLDAIDPASVGELHLAGHRHISDAHGDIVIDDHGSRVCDAVWRLYRHAVDRYGNVPTLIEWDTEIPALQVLLDEAARARAICNNTLREVAA
jgi:uncharacterized protein (UPF0276 family)